MLWWFVKSSELGGEGAWQIMANGQMGKSLAGPDGSKQVEG